MQLTKELFVIPEGDSYILYAPLRGAVSRVNGGTINLLKKISSGKEISEYDKSIVKELQELGFMSLVEEQSELECMPKSYKPTAVTLMPTLDCNLRCVYCYSRGGEDTGKDMSFEIAKTAIDLIVDNALETKAKSIHLGFHGGGEPFYPRTMPLVKQAVSYFREKASKHSLKANTSSATNGVINSSELEWIIQNFNHLNLSLDGDEGIQNKQRPLRNGEGSYEKVVETIRVLEKVKFVLEID